MSPDGSPTSAIIPAALPPAELRSTRATAQTPAARPQLPYKGAGAIVPASMLGDYERCLADVDAGASSCRMQQHELPQHWFEFAPLLLLGSPYRGWMLEVATHGRHLRARAVHSFRLVAPDNRRALLLGRIPTMRGCNEESGENGGVFMRERSPVMPTPSAFDANPIAAQYRDSGRTLEVTLEEVVPGCGDCGCQCGTAHAFLRSTPVRLRIPRTAR